MHSSHVVHSGDIHLHVRMTQPADHSAREHPVIVLVHGYPDDSSVWNGVRDTLAHERRVLTFDMWSAGLSNAPADTTGYRIPQPVDDLAAVADALLPGKRFHLVGHDWGFIRSRESVTTDRLRECIASYMSISDPCLDHVGHWMRAQLDVGTFTTRRAVQKQRLQSWCVGYFHLPLVSEWSWRLRVAHAWPWWLHETEGIRIDAQRPTLVRDTCNGVRMYCTNSRDHLARSQACASYAPVQLIVPTRDRYVSPAVTHAVEAWVSYYWRHEVGTGHWLPLHRPEWVADYIRRFADYVESDREPAELQRARMTGTLAPA